MTEIKPGTPLPWAQSHREHDSAEYGRKMYSTEVYCADGKTIATLAWYPNYRPDGSIGTHREANAAYIVAACNAYPSLLNGLREARDALAEAREALHFHYVEWDGEPEDAVPLQLARSKCDAAKAKLDTLLSQEGGQ